MQKRLFELIKIILCFRSITKILGDWWANLDKDEKGCYTDLAKQVSYKTIMPMDILISYQITFFSIKMPSFLQTLISSGTNYRHHRFAHF